jgi:hypothetical protein
MPTEPTPAIHPQTSDPATLVDRLRGIYRLPITDGLGAVGGSEEPDNTHEYVRRFQTTPIQHAAADEIERLRAERDALAAEVGERSKANAALIAAAPDLLAALRRVLPLLDMAFDHDGDVFRRKHNKAVDAAAVARAAIAKAQGAINDKP